jgi:hypothetical protein
MVQGEGISDLDSGAWEVGLQGIELLAKSFECAALDGQIGRVEAYVEGAIQLAGHGAREVREGAQQIVQVIGMRVVSG